MDATERSGHVTKRSRHVTAHAGDATERSRRVEEAWNRCNREILRMLRKPWFLSIGQRF